MAMGLGMKQSVVAKCLEQVRYRSAVIDGEGMHWQSFDVMNEDLHGCSLLAWRPTAQCQVTMGILHSGRLPPAINLPPIFPKWSLRGKVIYC